MSQQYQHKFSNFGSLALAGTIIHQAPANNSSVVKSIRFNNPSACAITLSHYDASTATTSVIYTINLSAGDYVEVFCNQASTNSAEGGGSHTHFHGHRIGS